MIDCYFNDITERDMDLLFCEEFVCSVEFLEIFTTCAGIGKAKVISVSSSKADVALGETDITVIVDNGIERIGLLIEDKIDAPAMPEQASRYFLRGKKGILQGDYKRFFVFIIAPKSYLSQNTEAQKYPLKIEYERVLSYFECLGDQRAEFKIQQIKKAINKQKKGYQVEVDPSVTEFWRQYANYQKQNYPNLDLIYSGGEKGTNATWPRFNTVIDGLYMYHKTESGYVDLTFEGCAKKTADIERLLSKAADDYIESGLSVHKTGKSATIRLYVPVIDFHKSFETQVSEVKSGFVVVNKLSDMVKKFDYQEVSLLINT